MAMCHRCKGDGEIKIGDEVQPCPSCKGLKTEDAPETEETPETENADKNVKRTREKRHLACPLTTEELLHAGDTLSRKLSDFDQVTAELESFKAQVKGKQKTLEAEIGVQRSLVRDKVEWREVECEEIMDWDDGTVTIVRLDTGEETEKRKMRADERQLQLPLDPDPEPDVEEEEDEPQPPDPADEPVADDDKAEETETEEDGEGEPIAE